MRCRRPRRIGGFVRGRRVLHSDDVIPKAHPQVQPNRLSPFLDERKDAASLASTRRGSWQASSRSTRAAARPTATGGGSSRQRRDRRSGRVIRDQGWCQEGQRPGKDGAEDVRLVRLLRSVSLGRPRRLSSRHFSWAASGSAPGQAGQMEPHDENVMRRKLNGLGTPIRQVPRATRSR
jgi:hypothetical protein